jgi:predicted DNA-binding transcriptional regulator AlpA
MHETPRKKNGFFQSLSVNVFKSRRVVSHSLYQDSKTLLIDSLAFRDVVIEMAWRTTMTLPQDESEIGVYSQNLECTPRIIASQFLTKQQFAELFQVSERTIDRWLTLGLVPPETRFNIGGCVRFKRQAIENWIQAGQPGIINDPLTAKGL